MKCKICEAALRADNKIGTCRKHRHLSDAKKAYVKNWMTENKHDRQVYMSEYRDTNRDRLNKHQKSRLKSDPEFKLRHAIRTRLNRALSRAGKQVKTAALFGCSIAELRQHLERQFEPGMTWENHGRDGWHIDHIVPLTAFDLSNPEHLARAQHYTNLRPMWAADNIRKRDRIEYSQECPTPRTGDDVR